MLTVSYAFLKEDYKLFKIKNNELLKLNLIFYITTSITKKVVKLRKLF